MSNHETFKFEVPPASEDTKAPGLLAGVGSGGFMDTQKSVRRPLSAAAHPNGSLRRRLHPS